MIQIKTFAKLALMASISIAGLSGCSIGQSEFTCSAGNENALCGSSSAIYKATNGEITENDKITVIRGDERIVVDANSFSVGDVPVSVEDEDGNVTMIAPVEVSKKPTNTGYTFSYDGSVIRSDAEVMRIWVAPWVDKEDDLNLSSLIYTDIEAKKWDVVATNEKESKAGVIPHLKKTLTTEVANAPTDNKKEVNGRKGRNARNNEKPKGISLK